MAVVVVYLMVISLTQANAVDLRQAGLTGEGLELTALEHELELDLEVRRFCKLKYLFVRPLAGFLFRYSFSYSSFYIVSNP